MSQTTQQTHSIKFDKVQALYGAPYVYGDVCLVYSPTLKEIAQIGVSEFYRMLQIMTIHPPTLSKKLADVSAFDYIVDQARDPAFAKDIRKAISLFTKEDCLIIPDASVIAFGGKEGDDAKFYPLTSEDLSFIQEMVRLLHWLEPLRAVGSDASDKAQQILDKIARSKQIVQAVKSKGPASGDGIGLADIIASMAIAIPGLNINNIWDLTYYSLYDQYQRYQLKARYETNVSYALAGAKIPKKELEGWIHPIKT